MGDATYRFTADNWDVPQFVYVYAHNDKDSHDTKNAVLMPKRVSVSKSGNNLVLTTASMGATSSNSFVMTAHGLVDDDIVIYAKPAAPTSNIAQLTDGTAYYVRDATANTFKL